MLKSMLLFVPVACIVLCAGCERDSSTDATQSPVSTTESDGVRPVSDVGEPTPARPLTESPAVTKPPSDRSSSDAGAAHPDRETAQTERDRESAQRTDSSADDVPAAANQHESVPREGHAMDDSKSAAEGRPQRAVCVLTPLGDGNATGTIEFVQDGDRVRVTGEITGLPPGEHGFHVHEFGDLSDRESGESAGSHFNPTQQPHGRLDAEKRHVGDLGNLTADASGIARIDLTVDMLQLTGKNSIVGRCLIVHSGPDKFTQPVGDAGGRIAGGVIGLAKTKP